VPLALKFDPADPRAALGQLPQAQAVFALYGAEARAEPYIGRTPNLRARLERLLQPSAKHPRRLHLAGAWYAASSGSSPARSSNRCSSSSICSKTSTARSA
jgi:hypothetical protein